MTRIALIGFGEVGQILAEDLAAHNVAVFDSQFADGNSIPSRALAGRQVRAGADHRDAAHGATLVISAVTAAETLNAARATAAGIEKGAFYLDLNSASPVAKRAAASAIEGAGGRFVEAAVMTPFPPKRIASAMLLGGPHAEDFLAAHGGLGFKAEIASREIGRASATKMCRSVIVKGLEALLTESMLAARRDGVETEVLASLKDLVPGADWPKLSRYMISRALLHGKRRAEEMREAARTVSEAGIEPTMSEAIAESQDWAAQFRSALSEGELGPMLDAMLARIAVEERVT